MNDPNEFIAKTKFGKFRVKINGDLISIGGKNFCVQITYKNEDDIVLNSLETKYGKCEIDNKEIQGPLTVHMVHLAFTILKENHPNSKIVKFIDSSSFMCEGRPMGLMKTSLLLHGETYYQRKFGAIPRRADDTQMVREFKEAWLNSKLPDSFDFINKDLNQILTDIYKSCKTWAEFSGKLNERFGRKVCSYILPWFLEAVATIYDREITTLWFIDITDKPNISYERISYSGGRRKTLKNIKYEFVHRPEWDRHNIFDLKYK
jgi:hypothetical protein